MSIKGPARHGEHSLEILVEADSANKRYKAVHGKRCFLNAASRQSTPRNNFVGFLRILDSVGVWVRQNVGSKNSMIPEGSATMSNAPGSPQSKGLVISPFSD